MKKLLFIFSILVFAATTQAQKIDFWGQIPYSKQAPRSTPKVYESQFWFNTTNSTLYTFNRQTKEWESKANKPQYAEMSISNDTTSISFAATTPAPVEELTAGLMSGFSMVSDSALRYDGLAAGTFTINYSFSVSFAEAANILNGYPVINTTPVLRSKFRQTATLTTDRVQVSGTGIISLTPGQTVRFLFFPSTHTGTDVLTIYEANVNLVQLN